MPRVKTAIRPRSPGLSTPQRKKLNTALQRVEEAGLVRRVEAKESTFAFKHALTQDAAYMSLLLTRRRALHQLVGQAYEQLESSGTDELVGLLAHHFAEAGDDAKTAVYSVKAGHNALAQIAYSEAAMNFYRALGALRRLPDTLDYRRQRVDAINLYLETAWGATLPQEHLKIASEGEALARTLPNPDGTLGDSRRLARIRTMRAAGHLARNEYPQVLGFAGEVLAEAKQLGDAMLLATPSAQMGAVLSLQGHFRDAESFLERGRALTEDTPDRWEWSWCVGFLGIGLAMRGQVQHGLALADRAVLFLQTRENMPSLVQVLVYRLVMYLEAGTLQALVQSSREAIAIAPATHLFVFAAIGQALQALAHSRLGAHTEAAEAMQASYATAARIGGQPLMMFDWIAAAQAEILLNAGEYRAAHERAERAAALAHEIGGVFAQGWAHRIWGQALAYQNDPVWASVDAHMEASVHAFQECGAVLEIRRTHTAWGSLFQLRGDAVRASRQFELAAQGGGDR